MSPDPLPLSDREDEICDRQIEASTGDHRLTVANVRAGIELGTFDGCAQWALGIAVGQILCGGQGIE